MQAVNKRSHLFGASLGFVFQNILLDRRADAGNQRASVETTRIGGALEQALCAVGYYFVNSGLAIAQIKVLSAARASSYHALRRAEPPRLPATLMMSASHGLPSLESTITSSKTKISRMLRVTEIFHSIQGESTHAGRPCTFVRLTGCPMRCSWCDSEYTFTGGDHFTIDQVMQKVRDFGCQLVEVTGGEPLAQKEAPELVRRLCDEEYEVLIETGGYVSTADVDQRAKIILDIKCPASGESERNDWSNLDRLRADRDEVKFVIANREDWDFAIKVVEQNDLENRSKAVLISPAWGLIDLQELAEWITKSRRKFRLQLQLHKYIWGPDVHGV
jgi:7-carboxy-7-deazaguanine synthase